MAIPVSKVEFPALCEGERSAPVKQRAPPAHTPPRQRDLFGRQLEPRTERSIVFRQIGSKMFAATTRGGVGCGGNGGTTVSCDGHTATSAGGGVPAVGCHVPPGS